MSHPTSDLRSLMPEPAPIAVIRTDSPDSAHEMALALVAGGLHAVEVTLTIPDAPALIAELSADPRMLVGAGTVLSHRDVDTVVEAGARFVVSPGLDAGVVEASLRNQVAVVPGALTPTEVMAARGYGVTSTKLFPASTVGSAHLTALTQVFPEVGIVPTGGIGPADVTTWIHAGACAVGIGSVINSTFARSGPSGLHELASALIRSCEQAASSSAR